MTKRKLAEPKKTTSIIDDDSNGRRRSPRLKPSLKVSSPSAFLACSDVKNPDLKRYSFAVSPKRFKQVEKGSKRISDSPPNEAQESEGNSSSKLPSGFEGLRNEFATTPSSRQFTSASKVHERQQGKTPSRSRLATTGRKPGEYSNLLADNFLNNENDEIREADASPTAASFVGTPLVMGANVVEGRIEETTNANPTVSYGLTEIANMWGGEELSDEEVDSSSGIIIIGKYPVKEAWEPIVRSVINKYGDIAANYFSSPKSRSCALENLAEFLQTFQRKQFVELTEGEIEKALEFIFDFGKGGMDVGWLEKRLKDLLEARKKVKQAPILKEKKDKLNEIIKEQRKFLEIAEPQVKSAREKLRIALAEVECIKATTAEVKYFVDHLPLDGLF